MSPLNISVLIKCQEEKAVDFNLTKICLTMSSKLFFFGQYLFREHVATGDEMMNDQYFSPVFAFLHNLHTFLQEVDCNNPLYFFR